MKILIVDDEPHIQQLLEQTLEDLEDEGVELLTAGNGEEALEAARAERPDLIFLDVMMPRMSGFEVLERIKADPDLKETHVIMVTAKGQAFDRRAGMAGGAHRYMTKPFDPDDVYAEAKDILDKMR